MNCKFSRGRKISEIIQVGDSDFSSSCLKEPSVIRVGRLAVVEGNLLLGAIGEIASDKMNAPSSWVELTRLRLRGFGAIFAQFLHSSQGHNARRYRQL